MLKFIVEIIIKDGRYMKLWGFKDYTGYESYRGNKDLIKSWFEQCKCNNDVKRLVAFLYSIDERELLDQEIEKLIEEINKNGLDLFLKQYYKYSKFGFTSNILIV